MGMFGVGILKLIICDPKLMYSLFKLDLSTYQHYYPCCRSYENGQIGDFVLNDIIPKPKKFGPFSTS